MGNISKYGTFGIHEEWVAEYFTEPEVTFWVVGNNSLGNKQLSSFKAWAKDAELIDNKNILTPFGLFCAENIVNDPDLIWSLIWINICYNSELVKWFVNSVKEGAPFDRPKLTEMARDYFSTAYSSTTIEYAFQALMQIFSYSPFGEVLRQGEPFEKKLVRSEYQDLSEIAIAYSVYKFAEKNDAYALRVKDFYDDSYENGPAKEFCLSKESFEKGLRTLNSGKERVLIAELNSGLNHITLKEGVTALDIVKKLF
jgi:hypothetical protein